MRKIILLGVLLAACADPIHYKSDVTESAVGAKREAYTPTVTEESVTDTVPVHVDILPSAVQRAADARQRRRRWVGRVQVSRSQLWNVPDETGTEATVVGLLRIGGTEVEWQSERDLIGIWQVAQSVRQRHCDRERIPSITECVDGEETHLSALRRLSRFAMGMVPARRARQTWIRAVEATCEEPEGFPSRRNWAGRARGGLSLQERCQRAAELARRLVTGSLRRSVTGRATPIAWGGRCEVNGGACDDPLACRRGLARIPDTQTSNALWCRLGSRGCPPPVIQEGVVYSDEVCAGLRIPAPPRVRTQALSGVEATSK
jgi:hypothetical protein